MKSQSIPFLDLVAPHDQIKEDLVAVLTDAIAKGCFIGGEAVQTFERNFASFCGTAYCVGVNSGTDALRFALLASVPRDSIVLTVPNTFIATTEAISQAGATPYFIDVDERTYNMDPRALLKYLEDECAVDGAKDGYTVHRKSGKRVSAIVPVHLYGQPADMDALKEIADRFRVMMIEDACQAHGADYFSRKENKWRRAGSMSLAAAFSFYPGKNLGALGEGGAVTTDNAALAEKVSALRDHGSKKKYYHSSEGYNGRLDALQAGFLGHKLRLLDGWNAKRRECAHYYGRLLGSIPGIVIPFEPEWSRANYHLYIINVDQRDQLQQHLTEDGVGTGLHYPLPLHLQEAYGHLNYHQGKFPVAERLALRVLSLPMYPTLKREQQERVAESIKKFVDAHIGVY
jgi:dTDP-4-amino-4,6-dideoxygalactose transaminase